MNWKWEQEDLHLYKISRASAEALAHTSGVVDDAPEAFWSLNAFPRPEKKILIISYSSHSRQKMREDSRVKSTTSTSHILLDDLCNNTDILNHILTVYLSTLDSFQDGFGARLERKSRITITGNLILFSQFRLGFDK